jgi:hypothetical protein
MSVYIPFSENVKDETFPTRFIINTGKVSGYSKKDDSTRNHKEKRWACAGIDARMVMASRGIETQRP